MRGFPVLVVLLTAPLLPAAQAPAISPEPVTILLDFEKPGSQVVLTDVQQGLQSILDAIGLAADIRPKTSVQENEQFGRLFIFNMKGRCTMNPWPASTIATGPGPLAMAYSSNGVVLPFGEVQCDRVRESVQRVLGKGNSRLYNSTFGKAIGIVMAHEIYHMLSNSSQHTREGVTKESLTPRELLDGNLGFPKLVQDSIRSSVR